MRKSIWLICLFLLLTPIIDGQPWTWTDATGKTRTRAELDTILEMHRNWLRDAGAVDGKQANFSKADLREVDLASLDLRKVDFSEAMLFKAEFVNCDLTGANLTRAKLSEADLINANLTNADLTKANLFKADLSLVALWNTNLSETTLIGATFFGARLKGANLTGANLRVAHLESAIYEPKENPEPFYIADAHGLGMLEWQSNPKPLFMLRKSLFDDGFSSAAKQVTAAIHRNNQSSFERVFFDWTCEWGANWLRPLKLLGLLSLICTIIYRTGMHFEMRSGLYLAATGQRIRTDKGRERTIRIGCHHPARILTTNVLTDECAPSVRPKARLIALRRRLRLEFTALGTAFLFSLMSVFNIGFREFNFGRWVRMMQPREFDIRARGWIRTVSGVQSLLGFAFAVLSLLSYFGRPFD